MNARRLVTGAVVVMFAVGLAACDDPPLATPNAPTFDHDFPDPAVIRDGTGFRAFSTNVGFTTTPTISSPTVGGPWNPTPFYPPSPGVCCYGYPNTADGGDALQTRPAWDTHELGTVWAPAVWQPSAGKYVMYFTDRVNTGFGPRQCIGVATATTARGPYTPTGSGPIVCQASLGGTIDPSVFVTTSGGGGGRGKPKPTTTTAYLLFKNDGNCCGMGTFIWSQQLASDGLSVKGSANGLIGRDQAWENGDAGSEPWKNLVEAPTMVSAGGSYYLFYSANWWESSNYAIGYALCTAPTSGCSKPRNGPIMASGDQGAGPGGQDVFADGTGQLWMTYAAWTPNLIGYQPMSNPNWQAYKRSLRFTKISLSNGAISFGGGP